MISFNKAKYDSTRAIIEALLRDINLQQLDILYYDLAAKRTNRFVLWGGIVSMGQEGLEIFETNGEKILRCFFNCRDLALMEIEEISYLEP